MLSNGKEQTRSPLTNAIEDDAYEWMQAKLPHYVKAIEQEIALTRSPEKIRSIASRELGPERQALVLRIYQVACYLVRPG